MAIGVWTTELTRDTGCLRGTALGQSFVAKKAVLRENLGPHTVRGTDARSMFDGWEMVGMAWGTLSFVRSTL